MKKRFVGTLVALIALSVASTAHAGQVLFDRGLPTANLNNAAGNGRSNVAWADWESSSTPSQYWLPGDDFTLSGAGAYEIGTIRVWTVGGPAGQAGLTLWGGNQGSIIAAVSHVYTVTSVTYGNGQAYQGSSGSYSPIYQVDFQVDFSLAGGQTYQFFVDGPWATYASGGYVNSFLHASNSALSGSTQERADGLFLYCENNGTVGTWNSGTGAGTLGWSAGWDKASDANVQVFGIPDGGTTVTLLGSALLGLGFLRRKFRG